MLSSSYPTPESAAMALRSRVLYLCWMLSNVADGIGLLVVCHWLCQCDPALGWIAKHWHPSCYW